MIMLVNLFCFRAGPFGNRVIAKIITQYQITSIVTHSKCPFEGHYVEVHDTIMISFLSELQVSYSNFIIDTDYKMGILYVDS